MPIEHINAKIKAFKIVARKYRNRRKRFGLRFNFICALINFDRGFQVGKSDEPIIQHTELVIKAEYL